jgi:predicted kinase
MELRVPAGALVVLVGVAGSGKSTFAAVHFAPDEVLSSDEYRALVAGDAADQSATGEAFRQLHAALDRRLRRGALTVVDATNIHPWARRQLLDAARAARRPTVAVVLDLPLAECLRRARGRSPRPVPDRVVRRQHRQLQASLPPLSDEGYAVIAELRDPAAVDAVRVVRVAGQSVVVEESATSRT